MATSDADRGRGKRSAVAKWGTSPDTFSCPGAGSIKFRDCVEGWRSWMVVVFRYLASGNSDDDPHLTARLQAKSKRLERYARLPEPVYDMGAPEFEEYIAALCRRDGCIDVQRVRGDHTGGQMTGYLPDGRKAAVKWQRECEDSSVHTHRLRTFDDAARAGLGAEVTIFIVLGPLDKREYRIAARRRLTLIDVDRLESWMTGTTLSALLVPENGRPGTNGKSAHD